jgi:N-acetylglucosaminyl-diphospho-decaprenol L-rhamnosyltransferase
MNPPTVNALPLERVTAVVVTFNSAHCVEDLRSSLSAVPHIIVADNASSDDTLAQLRTALPQARLIACERNLGFGAANNRAVTQAQTEWVLLLNPDCRIEPHAIEALVACADRFPQASTVAPQLVDANGRADLTYRWSTPQWASRGPGADGPVCVGFVTGACMLIRRSAMQTVGGFDEHFFLYYEDDDLCIRLQQHCGPLIIEPAARVMHRSRGSVGGPRRRYAEYLRGYHHIQSKFLFAQKHLGGATTGPRRMRYLVTAALETALRLLILDTRRAARTWGRVMGIVRWRAP